MDSKISLVIVAALLLSLWASAPLLAQNDDPWKGSVSAFFRPRGLFGVNAEYFVKPQLSVWGEAAFLNDTKTSVFRNTDPSQGLQLEDFGTFKNVQVQQTYRLGLRHYIDPVPSTWSFFVSTFGGYTNISDPTSAFMVALQNPGIQTSGFFLSQNLVARQQLELGGEIGLRFSVLLKYYVELSYQGFVERSLKDDDHDTTVSTKISIGYAF